VIVVRAALFGVEEDGSGDKRNRLAAGQQSRWDGVLQPEVAPKAFGAFYEPRTAGVSPAGSPSASLGVGTGGETPPEPAAEDGCATVVLLHGPKVHPILEVVASHEPERRPPGTARWMRLFADWPGRRPALHSPGSWFVSRSKKEQGTFHEPRAVPACSA